MKKPISLVCFATSNNVFSVLDKITTPDRPFSPVGDNVADTGKLVYTQAVLRRMAHEVRRQLFAATGERHKDKRIRTEPVKRREQ